MPLSILPSMPGIHASDHVCAAGTRTLTQFSSWNCPLSRAHCRHRVLHGQGRSAVLSPGAAGSDFSASQCGLLVQPQSDCLRGGEGASLPVACMHLGHRSWGLEKGGRGISEVPTIYSGRCLHMVLHPHPPSDDPSVSLMEMSLSVASTLP